MVVKIMVPFWIPIIIRHLIFRVLKDPDISIYRDPEEFGGTGHVKDHGKEDPNPIPLSLGLLKLRV